MAIGRATGPVFNLPSRYRRLSGPMTGIDADVVGNKSFKRPFPRIRSRPDLFLSHPLTPSPILHQFSLERRTIINKYRWACRYTRLRARATCIERRYARYKLTSRTTKITRIEYVCNDDWNTTKIRAHDLLTSYDRVVALDDK